MSFRFIEDHRATYPVRLMCAVLEVSPAGYYAWRARPVSARAASNSTLLAEIRQVHHDSGQRYGSPRVHAALRTQGRGASRGRIERLMRRYGIRAIMARPRRVRTTDSRHDLPIAPNLIARDFTAAAPNRVARRYHLHSNRGGLVVPGGRHGPVQPQDRRLGDA
jgi:putative transposase